MQTEQCRPNLGATFYQCRAAREAKLADTVFDLTTGMKVKEAYRRVGSLDIMGDKKVQSIFHGARVTKYVNGTALEVNQGITSSFDPATLTCISCKTEHKITDIRKNGQPATLIFSDQNFNSTWGEDGDNCIGIFRVENCSLTELTDMIMEVLDNITLRPGTVLLVGSVSSLHRHGTSIYAGDWVACTTRIEQRWSGVQVCPLTPLLYEAFPAELARELTELGAWLNEVYMGSPKGLSEVWASMVGGLAGSASVSEYPPAEMLYTIPLPSSLVNNCAWKEQKFKTYSPRAGVLPPMSSDTTDGLLRVLVFTLNRDLMAGLNPEALFSTENTVREDAKETTDHLVLIGASHLKRTIPYLKRLGYTITD
jgi:hypothetical protein